MLLQHRFTGSSAWVFMLVSVTVLSMYLLMLCIEGIKEVAKISKSIMHLCTICQFSSGASPQYDANYMEPLTSEIMTLL